MGDVPEELGECVSVDLNGTLERVSRVGQQVAEYATV
jgi:hypothetical protein